MNTNARLFDADIPATSSVAREHARGVSRSSTVRSATIGRGACAAARRFNRRNRHRSSAFTRAYRRARRDSRAFERARSRARVFRAFARARGSGDARATTRRRALRRVPACPIQILPALQRALQILAKRRREHGQDGPQAAHGDLGHAASERGPVVAEIHPNRDEDVDYGRDRSAERPADERKRAENGHAAGFDVARRALGRRIASSPPSLAAGGRWRATAATRGGEAMSRAPNRVRRAATPRGRERDASGSRRARRRAAPFARASRASLIARRRARGDVRVRREVWYCSRGTAVTRESTRRRAFGGRPARRSTRRTRA